MSRSAFSRPVFAAAALAMAMVVAFAAPASADSMAFFIKNQHARAMAIELQSQTRDVVWPGGDQVYALNPGERKSVPIDCDAGERICWAAWVVGDDRQSYGVGPDRDKECADCCSICVEKSTTTIVLEP